MCEGHHFFDWIPSFLCQFMLISLSTPPPLSSDVIAEWPVSIYVVLLWVVFCVMMSWVNGRKYENLLQFNTSWLVSVRMWFYFRLCFSFTCSGYDSPTPFSTVLFQYTFDRLVLLSKQVTGNKDILMISETKVNNSFPIGNFLMMVLALHPFQIVILKMDVLGNMLGKIFHPIYLKCKINQ